MSSGAPGVTIVPVRGLPAPLDRRVSAEIAAGLLADGVLAQASDYNAGLGYVLIGYFNGAQPNGARVDVSVTWELRQRESGVIQWINADTSLATALWTEAGQAAASALAQDGLSLAATYLAPQAPIAQPEQTEPDTGIRVAVLPVVGAPAQGAPALARALRTQLALRGYRLSDGASDVMIETLWAAEDLGNGATAITVTWTVFDAETLTELGTLSLENTLPTEALEGLWGPLSLAIATAGIDGLEDLIAAADDI